MPTESQKTICVIAEFTGPFVKTNGLVPSFVFGQDLNDKGTWQACTLPPVVHGMVQSQECLLPHHRFFAVSTDGLTKTDASSAKQDAILSLIDRVSEKFWCCVSPASGMRVTLITGRDCVTTKTFDLKPCVSIRKISDSGSVILLYTPFGTLRGSFGLPVCVPGTYIIWSSEAITEDCGMKALQLVINSTVTVFQIDFFDDVLPSAFKSVQSSPQRPVAVRTNNGKRFASGTPSVSVPTSISGAAASALKTSNTALVTIECADPSTVAAKMRAVDALAVCGLASASVPRLGEVPGPVSDLWLQAVHKTASFVVAIAETCGTRIGSDWSIGIFHADHKPAEKAPQGSSWTSHQLANMAMETKYSFSPSVPTAESTTAPVGKVAVGSNGQAVFCFNVAHPSLFNFSLNIHTVFRPLVILAMTDMIAEVFKCDRSALTTLAISQSSNLNLQSFVEGTLDFSASGQTLEPLGLQPLQPLGLEPFGLQTLGLQPLQPLGLQHLGLEPVHLGLQPLHTLAAPIVPNLALEHGSPLASSLINIAENVFSFASKQAFLDDVRRRVNKRKFAQVKMHGHGGARQGADFQLRKLQAYQDELKRAAHFGVTRDEIDSIVGAFV